MSISLNEIKTHHLNFSPYFLLVVSAVDVEAGAAVDVGGF